MIFLSFFLSFRNGCKYILLNEQKMCEIYFKKINGETLRQAELTDKAIDGKEWDLKGEQICRDWNGSNGTHTQKAKTF